MKRDVELVRQILLEIENKSSIEGWLDISIENHSPDEISYHVKILYQAGYIEAKDLSTKSGVDWRPTNLTWQGHEFLDASRSDKFWNKAKKIFGNNFLSVSFEVLKATLIDLAKKEIGII